MPLKSPMAKPALFCPKPDFCKSDNYVCILHETHDLKMSVISSQNYF